MRPPLHLCLVERKVLYAPSPFNASLVPCGTKGPAVGVLPLRGMETGCKRADVVT